MTHLWIQNPTGGWQPLRLDGDAYSLKAFPPQPVDPNAHDHIGESAPLLVHSRGTGSSSWVLLAGHDAPVRVNGRALAAGMCVLDDRDAIQIAGNAPCFLATEEPVRVEPFPGQVSPTACPRCTIAIDPETQAVRCPRCGIWHHQNSDRQCWTYAMGCAGCGGPTAMDEARAWSPEEL